MKRIFALAMALALSLVATCALAGEADLLLRKISRGVSSGKDVSWSKALVVGDYSDLIPCLIKSRDPEKTVDTIVEGGGRATRIGEGSILSAYVPVNLIGAIVGSEEVDFAEAAPLLSRKMDTARTYSGVVGVQDGSALGVPYTGTNVVVGVVDDSLDYGNPDFVDSNGVSRVQYVQQTIGGLVVECTNESIIAETCGITDGGQGSNKRHGTHVTGIAAGSNSTYTGVAPNSDIMFVFNSARDADTDGSFATAVIEGVNAIFARADLLDKAAVVNLSLGTSIGAHDGTSLLEQGLDELSGEKPGRVIVNAAGNEQVVPDAQPSTRRANVGGIHASINVPAGESHGHRIGIWNGAFAQLMFTGGTLVDVWLDSGQKDNCSLALFAYTEGRAAEDFTFPGLATTDNASTDGSSTFASADIPFATDTLSSVTVTDGTVRAEVDIDSVDARNDKPRASVLLSGNNGSDLNTRWFDVVIRATGAACSGNMWLYFDYTPIHDFLQGVNDGTYDVGNGATYTGYALEDGDSLYTTTIPATANKVIAVGSFMPPKPVGSASSEWTGNDGTTYDQSDLGVADGTGSATADLSVFSSLGPTADGRTKPAIVAPGEPIISTKARDASTSSAITVGDNHFKLQGTSMSSPHAAGIVALLLERNNTLTTEQVRTALQVGADTSGMTVKTPDAANSYGAGKVDAAQVLTSVVVDTSAYSGGGGGSSSSNCSLVEGAGSGGHLIAYSILVLLAIGLRRRLFSL